MDIETVRDTQTRVAPERHVAVKSVTPEVGAVRQLRAQRSRKAEAGNVEIGIPVRSRAFHITAERGTQVEDHGGCHRRHPVDYVSVVDALQGELSIGSGPFRNAVGGTDFCAIVGGVAERNAMTRADILIELEYEVVEMVDSGTGVSGEEEVLLR